jgi:ABC-type uncharacterized transport system substrate-binding protein
MHVTEVGVAEISKHTAMEEVDNIIIETLKDIGW